MPRTVIWILLHRVYLCTAVSMCHPVLVMLLVTPLVPTQGRSPSRKSAIFLMHMRFLGMGKIFWMKGKKTKKQKNLQTLVPFSNTKQNWFLLGELRSWKFSCALFFFFLFLFLILGLQFVNYCGWHPRRHVQNEVLRGELASGSPASLEWHPV